MYRVYFRRTRQGSVYFVAKASELEGVLSRLKNMGYQRNQCRVVRM